MTTTPSPAWRFRSLGLLLLMLSHGCYDNDPAEPRRTRDTGTREAEDLGEAPYMLQLAREIPGFAGFFYEPDGDRVVVAMTEANAPGFPVARQAVSVVLARGGSLPQAAYASDLEFVERVVDYSFIELARHRARLRPHIFRIIPEVTSLSVDEEFNRIKIGLLDLSATKAVLDLAIELAVPIETISFSVEPAMQILRMPLETPRIPLSASASLEERIRVPDGRLRGGYEIQTPEDASGRCTLGFTAIRMIGDKDKAFVTASHCSYVPWLEDDGGWYQDWGGAFVGQEVTDPETHRCEKDVFGPNPTKDCRHADATLVGVSSFQDNVDIALGDIGRTIERDDCDHCSASRTIDQDNPIIRIASQDGRIVDNEQLHKIGIATGWTYGNVEDTCSDVEIDDSDIVIRCTDRVDFSVKLGDSGWARVRV